MYCFIIFLQLQKEVETNVKLSDYAANWSLYAAKIENHVVLET